MNKSNLLILICIFLLATFLRFYKLGEIPNGLYQDETAIGYNAYSLLTSGKDEHGVSWPLYFKSFGDWKLPVYIYATIIPIGMFGLTPFAVRFPSAFFGTLTVIAFYFLVKKLSTNNNLLSATAALLITINPWHLHYSRAAFEVSIGLFLLVTGVYFLLRSFFDKSPGNFLLGTLLFILNIYSYNLTRLLSPLIYLGVLFLYRKNLIRVTKPEKFTSLILSLLLLTPLVMTLGATGGISSASGTLIYTSAPVQAPLLEFRSFIFEFSPALAKIFFNRLFLTIWQYILNFIGFFSVPFFFISGPAHGNHGIGTDGLFYLLDLLLIPLGTMTMIKNGSKSLKLLIYWSLSVVAAVALTRESPHATRSFFLIAPTLIFSAVGLHASLAWARQTRPGKRLIAGSLLTAVALYSFVHYFSSYYLRFPVAFAKAWKSEDQKLVNFIKKNEIYFDKIIVDPATGFVYTSLLFYYPMPAADFQRTAIWTPDDSEGFSSPKAFGKYELRSIDWELDIKNPRTLVVTTIKNKPPHIPAQTILTYPKRPVVISNKQEILTFPIEDIAYVVVETTH